MRTLFHHGLVHTPDDPGATAVLVEDDRIAWVGHEGAALAQADGVDREIDLAGALVTPAFVDAHVHVTATGMNLTGLDLTGTTSGADVLDRVRRHCASVSADDIVLGHGWDESTWSDPTLPTREDLDAACGGSAVYLTRIDVHSALASTALLDRLPDVTDVRGFHPTGPLHSDAHHEARGAVLDSITADQRRRLHQVAFDAFARAGIAAVHEMAGPDISSRTDLTELLAADSGPAVTAYWGELGGAATAGALGAIGAGGDLFADGALGSHTAFLSAPYADADTRGVRHVSAAEAADHIIDCVDHGVQAGFHVIGDGALAEVLDGFRRAADSVGDDRVRAGRHRLEHVEMPTAADLATIARLGLTVSVQPQFDALWGGPGGMYAARLGERAAALNPFAAFARSGIAMAFGSDTPVTAVTPWHSVAAAMFHHTESARISARAAFGAHTRGGWRAVGIDDAGVIRPGFRASLAVWDAGELAVQAPDERIAGWSTDPRSGTPPLPTLVESTAGPDCLLTMADGRVIHDAWQ
ncbi:MAG: amidohydrolase family protein [Candidatus Nanopelagicales bacterium]